MNGTPLSRIGHDCKETTIKFLGIYIDEFIILKKHLAYVNSKIHLKHIFPCDNLRSLYFALIHPHISYGNLGWINASPTLL